MPHFLKYSLFIVTTVHRDQSISAHITEIHAQVRRIAAVIAYIVHSATSC